MRRALSRIIIGWFVLAGYLGNADGADRLRVLIVDGQNNHNWADTTPYLKKVLEDSGRFTVDVATTPAKGQPNYKEEMARYRPEFGKYDVVLSNYNGDDWPVETRKDLHEFVANGKGLVIVHAANNSFPGWPEYNLMIGMGWRDAKFGERVVMNDQGEMVRVEKGQGPGAGHGPQHPFTVAIRKSDHPVTQGMPAEWLHAKDELYHGMRGPVANVTLLATAYSAKDKGGTGEHEPMMWTVSYGKGRVFHTPMGHVMGNDLTAMKCVGFVATVLRGTEWAGTEKVTIPLPSDFPTASGTRLVK